MSVLPLLAFQTQHTHTRNTHTHARTHAHFSTSVFNKANQTSTRSSLFGHRVPGTHVPRFIKTPGLLINSSSTLLHGAAFAQLQTAARVSALWDEVESLEEAALEAYEAEKASASQDE